VADRPFGVQTAEEWELDRHIVGDTARTFLPCLAILRSSVEAPRPMDKKPTRDPLLPVPTDPREEENPSRPTWFSFWSGACED
jgi:hypothetical protein